MKMKKTYKKNLFIDKQITFPQKNILHKNHEFVLDFERSTIGFNPFSFINNYREYLPPNELKDFIKHYWFLEINNPTDQERFHELLPRAEYEMLIVYKDPFIDVTNNNKKLVGTMINGINSRRRTFRATGTIGIFSICFKPYALRMLTQQPIRNYAERYTLVDKAPILLKGLSMQLLHVNNPFERMIIANEFFYERFIEKNKPQTYFPIKKIISDINYYKGTLNIDEITERYFCSRSKLERNFCDFIGITPKKYCRLIRFKNALLKYILGMNDQDIVFQLGFYDQAHLINEFQKYLGESPGRYINKKKQDLKVLFNDLSILHSKLRK